MAKHVCLVFFPSISDLYSLSSSVASFPGCSLSTHTRVRAPAFAGHVLAFSAFQAFAQKDRTMPNRGTKQRRKVIATGKLAFSFAHRRDVSQRKCAAHDRTRTRTRSFANPTRVIGAALVLVLGHFYHREDTRRLRHEKWERREKREKREKRGK